MFYSLSCLGVYVLANADVFIFLSTKHHLITSYSCQKFFYIVW